MSPDGPLNLTITREDHKPWESATIYNMCPGAKEINLTCHAGGVEPGANFTMTSSPEGVVPADCDDVAQNCSYSILPSVPGEYEFNCTAVNSLFDNFENETTFAVTVQGKTHLYIKTKMCVFVCVCVCVCVSLRL